MFAVITVDDEQRHATTVKEWTASPCWNESFDLRVTKESVIKVALYSWTVAVQAFNQQTSKKPAAVFLGSFTEMKQRMFNLNS
ncbi:hypothetical protein Q7P36_003917 [Cladosporium allicinum]